MYILFRAMTAADIPKDVVIVSLVWRPHNPSYAEVYDKSPETKVRCHGNRYRFSAVDDEGSLEAVLVPYDSSRTILPTSTTDVTSVGDTEQLIRWRSFSPTVIQAFTEAVGDVNPIHRDDCCIVPGCLLLAAFYEDWTSVICGDKEEELLQEGDTLGTDIVGSERVCGDTKIPTTKDTIKEIRIRFRNPVHADTPLFLRSEGPTDYTVITADGLRLFDVVITVST
ncbi:hypothetical protein [uncultured Veillonella sp.]|uniref:hypothetical protein n=1 Tax=uncultured Veillonella sp. TaxID=159268 RepID=UPI0025919C38|nr:hypothetical protein [uncultured Veillonella sp.]